MAEEEKCKTAFQAGTLKLNFVPFGLINVSEAFQGLMKRCMEDINMRDCLIYLIDIVVFSSNFEEHLWGLKVTIWHD